MKINEERVIVTEEMICDSFRCYRGDGTFLGIKSPWWAHLVTPDEIDMIEVRLWKPTKDDLTIADKLLFDVFLSLSPYERKILFLRCGKGKMKSLRKCGKIMNVHHEVFRQEIQQVIVRVQKILDEVA